MSIVNHDTWEFSEKGKKDAERHREKIKDQIRKNIKNVIGEETIITKKDNKKVRIPIKGMKDYHFKTGLDEDDIRGGVGQGKGKPGDVIARQPGNGNDPNGKPGNERGEEYMEVEVDIDYLIKIMFDDLGLPYIEEKTKVEQLIPVGWKFDGVTRIGIQPRLHKKKTINETLKRTFSYIGEIIEETGCDERTAECALVQSQGDLEEAINIVKENNVDLELNTDILYIEDDDLRYKNITEQKEPTSNAVIIAMLDISGSMTQDKKYLSRSFLFWMVEFLKKTYKNVQIKFIVHTTEAKLVDENEFFKIGEYGGTMCSSAFKLANHLIETEFPKEEWNSYVIYNSDGDDFDYDATMKETRKLLDNGINMLGYLEINPTENAYISGELLKRYKKEFNMKASTIDGKTFFKDEKTHFLACEIKDSSYVFPALKHFLFKK